MRRAGLSMSPNAVANAVRNAKPVRHKAEVAAAGVRIDPAVVVGIAAIATSAIDHHASFTMPSARPAVNPRRCHSSRLKADPFIAAIVSARGRKRILNSGDFDRRNRYVVTVGSSTERIRWRCAINTMTNGGIIDNTATAISKFGHAPCIL